MGIGIGLQVFLSEKSKLLGCKLYVKKKAFGGNTGSTTVTSFFSFFSLVPLGCCGWWLYALSLLPSVVGTGVSAVLIEYSQVLVYVVTREQTGKVKRLKNNLQVKFALCTMKGKVTGDWVSGTAKILTDEQTKEAVKMRDKKYGFMARIAKFVSKNKGEFFAFTIKID